MLRGGLAVEVADFEEGAGAALEPIGSRMGASEGEQLVEQAAMRHAIAQTRLIGGEHEQHLVNEKLRVIRIAGAAEAKQQINLVDAGKIAGIGAAINLAADAIGLVVRPNAEEEAVDVKRGEEA